MVRKTSAFSRGVLRSGIRRSLFLLAVVLTLPLAIFSFVRARERLHSELDLLKERSRSAARQAGQLIDADVNTARIILSSVSTMIDLNAPAVQNDSILQFALSEANYSLTNLIIADSSGRVRGSLRDITPTGRTRVSSEPFLIAMRTRLPYIGEARRSLILPDSGWVLPITAPILKPATGELIGVGGASLAVDSLSAMRFARDLPRGTLLSVIRRDGTIFLRNKDIDKWIGKVTPDTALLRFDLENPDSVRAMVALDGSRYLAGHAEVKSVDGLLLLGIPMGTTIDAAERQFAIDLFVGSLGTLLIIIFALITANKLSKPLVELTDVAHSLRSGDRMRRALASGHDEVGELARSLNQLADAVDERELALRASEARYRQLFATSPLPTLTWRMSDGRIEQANDAARLFFGEDRLARGVRILDLISGNQQDAFADLPLPDPSATLHAGLWSAVGKNGDLRDVEVFIGALEQHDQTVAVGVLIDVTVQKRAEEELEQSREHLRQVQKLEALGAFAGGIAHDFNNYLSAIATNAEMMESELPVDSHLRVEVSEILGAAQRATALTRQILVFSRRQVVHDERVDVNAAIEGMHRLLSRLVGEQIEVRIACAPDVPQILFDQGRLEQVLMNLAANARDAMPSGGVLTISTERTAGGDLRLTVTDTGSGIPDDVLSHVFEPFFTTKPRERGTGLGLSMVYSIITAAGGEASISSKVGQGTKITMTLPGLSDDDVPIAMELVPPAEEHRGNEHILVVEDDASVRQATSSLLTRAGYQVSTADGAASARKLLEEMETPPALILSDVVMPYVSGPKMAAEIAQLYPSVRILFMSGYADDDVVMQGIATGSLRLIAKPFTSRELLKAIRDRLDDSSN